MLHADEELLAATRSDRTVRLLQEVLVIVAGLVGISVTALVWTGAQNGSPAGDMLFQAAFGIVPALAVLWFRAPAEYILTNRRVIVLKPGREPVSAEYSDVTGLRRWLGTLWLKRRGGSGLALEHLREVHLVEALIRERMRP